MLLVEQPLAGVGVDVAEQDVVLAAHRHLVAHGLHVAVLQRTEDPRRGLVGLAVDALHGDHHSLFLGHVDHVLGDAQVRGQGLGRGLLVELARGAVQQGGVAAQHHHDAHDEHLPAEAAQDFLASIHDVFLQQSCKVNEQTCGWMPARMFNV